MVSAGGMGRAKAEIVPALVTLAVRCHCSVMASPDHDVSRRGGDVGPHRYLEDQTDHSLFFCHLSIFCSETLLSRFLVASQPVRDLLLCDKHLFVAARTKGCSHHQTSATSSGSVSLAIA